MLENLTTTREAVELILETFSAEDGGVKLIKLGELLTELERRAADEADPAAKDLLLLVTRFAKLIEVANRK